MNATDTITIVDTYGLPDTHSELDEWRQGDTCADVYGGKDACRVCVQLPTENRGAPFTPVPYEGQVSLSSIDVILPSGALEAFIQDVMRLVREYIESGKVVTP